MMRCAFHGAVGWGMKGERVLMWCSQTPEYLGKAICLQVVGLKSIAPMLGIKHGGEKSWAWTEIDANQ